MDIDEKLERCDELDDVIDTLDSLYNRIYSDDIKSDILDIVTKYEEERQNLENELQEEAEEEKRYLNREYMREAL